MIFSLVGRHFWLLENEIDKDLFFFFGGILRNEIMRVLRA